MIFHRQEMSNLIFSEKNAKMSSANNLERQFKSWDIACLYVNSAIKAANPKRLATFLDAVKSNK